VTGFDPPELLNIADWFLGARLREGRDDRTALRLRDATLTYADVDALASRYAAALRGLGVRQEERVMIALPDGADFVGALFGVLKLGAVVVMINPQLPASALAGILDYGRVPAAVVDDGSAELFAAATTGRSDRPQLLRPGDLEADTHIEPVSTHRDDPAIWLFSGGTTGQPKAVVQTHLSFANTTEWYAKRALGYGEDDVTLSVPKLFFGYATGANLFFPFSVGASAVLFPEPPTPAAIYELAAVHRATILVNVPAMVAQMVDEPGDLSSLRLAISAGEALPPVLHERWSSAFGVELLDGLGTAEMWHIFVSNLPGRVRPGTIGVPVPGFEVEVRDADGRSLPPGEVGALWVRGDSRAIGYWRNMERTKSVFRGEWVVTGDLVRRDDDGYFTYAGRDDDAMKVKGRWLLPAEVEDCLLQHPSVLECGVVGVPDPAGLVKPVAFVAAPDAAAGLADELRQFALERLEPYKHPRRVVVLDHLPRTHLGKIDRSRLKDLASASEPAQ
jgi:benzoate-CoA ligase family protein